RPGGTGRGKVVLPRLRYRRWRQVVRGDPQYVSFRAEIDRGDFLRRFFSVFAAAGRSRNGDPHVVARVQLLPGGRILFRRVRADGEMHARILVLDFLVLDHDQLLIDTVDKLDTSRLHW